MKRYVPFAGLWFVVAAPLAVSTGCNIEPEMQRCVDYQNQIVSYSLCQFPSKPVRITGSINPVPRYRFYYGGFGGEEVGSTVWGGSEKALAGHVYRPVGVDAEVTRTIKNSPQPYVAGPIH